MKTALSLIIAAIATLAMPAYGAIITATNSTPGLFDGSSGTRSVTFTGSEPGFGSGTVLDLNVSVKFAKADGQFESLETGTPFYNEIEFILSNGATNVTLIAAGSFFLGTGSTGFDGTITFDDSATNFVNVDPNSPSSGTFKPTGPGNPASPGTLANFNGLNAASTWTLSIRDTTFADALRFREFTVSITTDAVVDAAVPEPGTLSIMGAGLIGLAGVSLRRRKIAKV